MQKEREGLNLSQLWYMIKTRESYVFLNPSFPSHPYLPQRKERKKLGHAGI